jgi:glycine/D-amino acid oxidase-like deaminating enzyme
VVCAGAWSTKLLGQLKLPIVVKRKTVAWLRPKVPERFSPEKFPVFLADLPEGILYGFPLHQRPGVKIANHSFAGPETTVDEADRNFHEEDAEDVKRFAGKHLRDMTQEVIEGKVCLYSVTPDEDFIIDFHPADKKVMIAAGFSGHGFKFAPVVGEILADLCVDGSTRHPIQKFQILRFLQART